MPKKNNNNQDPKKGGLIDSINDMTSAAKETVKQAENANQTPMGHISDMVQAARETAEAAKKQQHDSTASAIAQAQARDKERQHAREQAGQSQSGSGNPLQQVSDLARQAAEAAAKEKARKEAEDAAWWARIQAQPEEPFQGSGGVGSQEQLDSLREGYASAGIDDPSGLTLDADQRASSQDNSNKTSGVSDEDRNQS